MASAAASSAPGAERASPAGLEARDVMGDAGSCGGRSGWGLADGSRQGAEMTAKGPRRYVMPAS